MSLMSGEAFRSTQEREQDTCLLCGRMLSAGYYFVCHVCGATYCYSHMPEKCSHIVHKRTASLGMVSPKA